MVSLFSEIKKITAAFAALYSVSKKLLGQRQTIKPFPKSLSPIKMPSKNYHSMNEHIQSQYERKKPSPASQIHFFVSISVAQSA